MGARERRDSWYRNTVQQANYAEVDRGHTDPVDQFVRRVLMALTVGIEPIVDRSVGHVHI